MTKTTERVFDCDVLIAGGGMSGVCAALAAARNGARVVLCQDRPVLGGNASSEVRMHIVGADISGKRGSALATEAREGGIIEEIRLENCMRNPQRSPSIFDLILYEKCRNEPNLTLLLNTAITGATVEGNRIRRVVADRNSTEERFAIDAAVFIDATGDGRLGHEAGAPYVEGRESRQQYGEPLAQPIADKKRLGSTIMFQARKHDRPMPFTAPAWARHFTEEELRLRPHGNATEFGDLGLEYGYWWVEWGGHLDTIKDGEQIRDELLAIVLGVWDHVKNGGDHGAECWALEWVGFLPGKRESRRFIGQHVLTETDLTTSRAFADAIAYGGWPMDLHPPHGVDAADDSPCVHHAVPHLYDIPLRACVSREIENLMFAGRNMSATHVAFASTRVMATCAVVGQGVGTAAAYAARHRRSPADLPTDACAMHEVQQQLLRDDAFLIGRSTDDTHDLARSATITASSQQQHGEANNVISGFTRCVHGPDGAAPGRTIIGTHRWMSDPAKGLPAWLSLSWPEPIQADRLQIIFDSGLHRVLTFSLADDYTRRMHWGSAPSETVRDYRVESRLDDRWQVVAEVKGNFQRRNVIELAGIVFQEIRLVVTATNGLDHARICEMRITE